MNKIYLPTLKSIRIKDFSLYSQNKDFTFDFIEGVNLIIGGNGIGKTTFINLIKYGLIGLYKKGLDVRTYNYERKEFRKSYSNEFFRKRMNKEYPNNEDAEITLCFTINDVMFEVTRGLYDIELKQVCLLQNNTKTYLEGKIIHQSKYDKLTPNAPEKENYLQYYYEKKMSEMVNVGGFNAIIFLVNQILFFGENRETILWDREAQADLSSKYFNDPNLDMEYEECKRSTKYYDSLSRHKSEDIRAVNLILERLEKKNDINNVLTVITQVSDIKVKIDKAKEQLLELQNSRKNKEHQLRFKKTKKANLNKLLQEFEVKLKNEESIAYVQIWEKINPDYDIYLENVKNIHACPMCNKALDRLKLTRILGDLDSCMLCEEPIKAKQTETLRMKQLGIEIENTLVAIRNQEAEIIEDENQLEKQDSEYNKTTNLLFENQRILRDLEHVLNSQETNDENTSYKTMYVEIAKLEEEKKQYQQISNEFKEKRDIIFKNINDHLTTITKELSIIFKEYAEAFLSVDCELSYDDLQGDDKKYYVPIIAGKEREDEEELSESQRFFIDHSFRMSILEFFYQAPTFYICETPDSSLDISYEKNAAHVFLRYLQKPNALIITTNLNNSTFLDYIIENTTAINCLNLLEYGNPSIIQRNSTNLDEMSQSIRRKIDGRL